MSCRRHRKSVSYPVAERQGTPATLAPFLLRRQWNQVSCMYETHVETVEAAAQTPIDRFSGITRDAGRRAMSALDHSRRPVADVLNRVGWLLHNVAPSSSSESRWRRMVHTTAHRLGSAARYLRQYDAEDILADFRRVVRSHPESAVMASVAAGFLMGTVLRRQD